MAQEYQPRRFFRNAPNRLLAAMTKTLSPTQETYDSLNLAHDYFNARLFGGKLPACLVTLQRSKKAYGFFAGQRFGLKTGKGGTDEIALNPSHFEQRTTEQTLSTLVHEMAHQWQQHHGKPSRTGYHNKEWAAKMQEVGLVPSSTGQPGGKEVGQKVSLENPDGDPRGLRPPRQSVAGPVTRSKAVHRF
jgi:hypothetical protein